MAVPVAFCLSDVFGAIGLHERAVYRKHGLNHRAGMDALWPCARTGNMDEPASRKAR